MCFPLRHGLSNCSVFSFVPYSCLFSRICAAYADVELLDLIYLMCSLNLMQITLPDCPTYTLLHVLHFNLYISPRSLCLFSSVQLLLYWVGCAKANFYIGLFEQVSYPSDQWAVVCKGYPFTSLCYFFLLLCLGLFLFFSLYYLCFQACQHTNWKFIDKEVNKELPEDDLIEDRNMGCFLKCFKWF